MSLALAGAGNTIRRRTQTAGTVISALIRGAKGLKTRVSQFIYNCAGTAHTITILRPIGRTKTTAAATLGATVINLLADPGPSGDGTTGAAGNNYYPQGIAANLLAANDLLAIRETDGVTRLYTVSSVAVLAITLTAALIAGVASGGDVWDYGVLADTDPTTGAAHETIVVPASAITTYSDNYSGVICSHRADEPILFQSNNATAAGFMEALAYSFEPSIGG